MPPGGADPGDGTLGGQEDDENSRGESGRATVDWLAEPSLARLEALIETKTVWHPIGV